MNLYLCTICFSLLNGDSLLFCVDQILATWAEDGSEQAKDNNDLDYASIINVYKRQTKKNIKVMKKMVEGLVNNGHRGPKHL